MTKTKIDPKVVYFNKKKNPEPYIGDDIIEDGERALSYQELIDALEICITKLEDMKATDPLKRQLKKTVVLICKILSVELNKQIDLGIKLDSKLYT